jgi:hypothetical protein
MIEGLISLASYYPAGGDLFGNVLFQWEQAGVFNYVLPFLIIFALVYGLLTKINLFTNQKGINIVLALSTALLSLQFNLVSVFFAEIFPRMGVGLAIILVLIILGAMFVPTNSKAFSWMMVIFGLVIFGTVLWNTFDAVGWNFGGGYWNYYSMNWGNIILILIVVGAIVGIVAPEVFKKKDNGSKPGTLFDAMFANGGTGNGK